MPARLRFGVCSRVSCTNVTRVSVQTTITGWTPALESILVNAVGVVTTMTTTLTSVCVRYAHANGEELNVPRGPVGWGIIRGLSEDDVVVVDCEQV